ncbi:MAG: acyltransferase family protein [Actinomycetota bacterium]
MERRIRALDGVRGAALLAVLGYHTSPGFFPGGYLGVEMFFVLSGFLLTTLLLQEHSDSGQIDVVAYAGRRFRRIVPAMFVLLAALLVFVPILAHGDAHRLRDDVLSSIAGITNWHLIAEGTSYFEHLGRPPFVRHLWSIAIEVQFYVLCPFVAAWVVRRRRSTATAWVAGSVAASAALMGILYASPDPSRAYFGTDTRISALLSGVLLALVLEKASTADLKKTTWRIAGPMAVGATVAMVLIAGERVRWMYPAGFLIVQAATAILIACGMRGTWPAGLLRSAPLMWLGKRSYGIYLWHWPLVILLRPGVDVGWNPAVAHTVTIAGALLLGALSFRYVERPLMRWKPSATDVRRSRNFVAFSAAAVALITVATLVRPLPTTDPIKASLIAGERALAAQEAKRESSPSPAPTRAGTSAAPNQETTRAVGDRSDWIVALGDSVMLGAAPHLQYRLGPAGYIYADKSRQIRHGIEIADQLRSEHKLGRVVVVHLGNNGNIKPYQLNELMAALKDVPRVLLLTVRVPKPWQDAANESIRDAGRRYPQATVVDWFKRSEDNREWFQSDGTHMSVHGIKQYAELIVRSIPPKAKAKPKPKPEPTPEPTPSPTPGLIDVLLPPG